MKVLSKIVELLYLQVKSCKIMARFTKELFGINNMTLREKFGWIHKALIAKRRISRVGMRMKKTGLPVSGTDINAVTKMRELQQRYGESDEDYRNRIKGAILNGDI